MSQTWMLGISAALFCYTGLGLALASQSRDMIDANGEYTGYGVAILAISTAAVAEMNCGKKGWMFAAVNKFDALNMHIDVNDKYDYSNIVAATTEVTKKAKDIGLPKWCTLTPKLGEFIGIR